MTGQPDTDSGGGCGEMKVAQSQPVTDHAADAAATSTPSDLERYAALGRACEANGLAGYGVDIFHGGEAMWFQPPGSEIADQTAEPLLRALSGLRTAAALALAEIHALDVATSWVDDASIDERTPPTELWKRVKFMQQDMPKSGARAALEAALREPK